MSIILTTHDFEKYSEILMYSQDLQLNSKNPNKKLVGSFVVEATVMTNAHSVIEDEVGNVVKVQIPNPPKA